MEKNEKHNLWQCANLFRNTCPHHKNPAMKMVVTLVQETFNEMTIETIGTAEELCKDCPEFVPEIDLF